MKSKAEFRTKDTQKLNTFQLKAGSLHTLNECENEANLSYVENEVVLVYHCWRHTIRFTFAFAWSSNWGQFHRAAKQNKLLTRKNFLNRFLWLPAKPSYKMYALWLVVCFILLSKILCLAALWNWSLVFNRLLRKVLRVSIIYWAVYSVLGRQSSDVVVWTTQEHQHNIRQYR